jgi:hypothetical protein
MTTVRVDVVGGDVLTVAENTTMIGIVESVISGTVLAFIINMSRNVCVPFKKRDNATLSTP